MAEAGAGPGCGAAEAAGGRAVADHVLLRLEEDDVQLGREQTAEHHGAAEADRHAHGGGLHLWWERPEVSLSQRPGPGPRMPPAPAKAAGSGVGEIGKHPTLGLRSFAKPQRISRRVGQTQHQPQWTIFPGRLVIMQGSMYTWEYVCTCVWACACVQRDTGVEGRCVSAYTSIGCVYVGVVSVCRCVGTSIECRCWWEDVGCASSADVCTGV